MRRHVLAATSVLGVVVLTIVLAAGSGSAQTGGRLSLASNKLAAKADAAKLLTEVALPGGAQKLKTEPAGGHGSLHPVAHLSSNPGIVDTAWWRVSATPDQVIAMAKASPPPRLASIGTGGGSNTKTGTSSTGLTFFVKGVSGVVERRMIEVTATALAGGGTGVMIQTQSEWVVPRPASSIIPDTARVISVTESGSHDKILRSATITARSAARRTVAYFNGLELGQPGTTSCGAEPYGADVIIVKFLPAARSKPVAIARFSGDFQPGDSGLSTQCNEVQLRVGAAAPVGLLGGKYITSLNRLLSTNLP